MNEVWDELEALLNSDVGWQWADARELYDILGDENVRKGLIKYSFSNCCLPQIDQNF
ncbi:unnamed protein product [Dibothriocephalus latus]|uniref:Uncharacterized protein n=1 Tax=Dibothriocephalus latus TaxID=60516 RepID=A0A3P7M2F3_DIBLA|nr:unnamed protein product [Dibothriocephalus latus]